MSRSRISVAAALLATIAACHEPTVREPAGQVTTSEGSPAALVSWDPGSLGINMGAYTPNARVPGDFLMDRIGESGAKWVRVDVDWDRLQLDSPNSWNTEAYDAYLAKARQYGLNVLGVIHNTSRWYSSACDMAATPAYCLPDAGSYPPRSLADWARFVDTLVRKMPTVSAWAIYNEPDCHFKVVGDSDPAIAYADLVATAAPIIRGSGRPIVVGEMAWAADCHGPVTSSDTLEIDEPNRDWLAKVLHHVTIEKHQPIDVISVHHYGLPEHTVRQAEVFIPQMYTEHQELLGAGGPWELWTTEFGPTCGTIYLDSDAHHATNVRYVFDHVNWPGRTNKQWRKAFYYDMKQETEGGACPRGLYQGWAEAAASNSSAPLHPRRAFADFKWLGAGKPALLTYSARLGSPYADWTTVQDIGDLGSAFDAAPRMYAFKAEIAPFLRGLGVGVCYRAHFGYLGWANNTVPVCDGTPIDPRNANFAIQAITMDLTNPLPGDYTCTSGYTANYYPVWDQWRCFGGVAGTTGLSKYLVGFRAKVWRRDWSPAGSWQ